MEGPGSITHCEASPEEFGCLKTLPTQSLLRLENSADDGSEANLEGENTQLKAALGGLAPECVPCTGSIGGSVEGEGFVVFI